MSEELDRSILDSKDREQLHAIAGAMGVRAATRMKKADLIDAILGAANGGAAEAPAEAEGKAATAAPKRVRSKRTSEADDPMSELAAEEDAIAAAGSGDEPDVAPRPARHAPRANGEAEAAADRRQRVERRRVDTARASGAATKVDVDDERQSYGEGNRRPSPPARPRSSAGWAAAGGWRRAPRA